MEVFITKGMLERLKESGLEICGTGFTATKAWYGDGKEGVDDNTVWTGYFWMDSWSTLEVAKTSFDGIDWNNYKAIRFCSEANRTNYVINVLTSWGDGGKLGDQGSMTMTNEYAELSIDNIDMAEKLSGVDRLMVQCNKEDGEPFNFTSIVLVKKESTGVGTVLKNKEVMNNNVYDLRGGRASSSTKGIRIVGGKKLIAR